ncbi:D-serine deaminase-like pyridoxal phosphate-dependent protein [Georgenia soli]|uniref:D-serine deaminase-like pyridoxal phosphate-dependent protein n=1 Tax=Georgenia soli TaxID=638953 RepID=A0A2A9F2H5_9MICO|nr:alanine racemase [Georgenia soli]PFG44971.1 D-serine deaminase-like pyridoxal phosphate-dependent protein [Georgenia soli]
MHRQQIAEGPVGWRFKGLPTAAHDLTIEQIGQRRYGLFDPAAGVEWPALVLRESALRHNASVLARFCAKHNVSLAPHGKTAVSPQLWALQAEAGAWGVSVATPHQTRAFRAAGARRILMANELVNTAFAQWVQREIAAGPEFEFYCYVDSVAGVELLDAALDPAGPPLPVLLELGHAGGRAGCRDSKTALNVARAAAQSRRLSLVGVAGYEGSVSHDRDAEGLAAVGAYLAGVVREFEAIAAAGLFDAAAEEYLLSAGGSIYFDVVAEEFNKLQDLGRNVRRVIRSGAYLTHDHGFYTRLSPLGSPEDGGLIPAAEVWSQVLSLPEPGLAILDSGRRDLPYDQDLPQPLALRRGDSVQPIDGWRVTSLNDQHAFVSLPPDSDVQVGDLIQLGISHPCTLHDKWQAALIADEQDYIVGVARSFI